MAVPEQTPYIEHTGNGVTTSFSLGFQCESKDHLIVLVDEIEPPIATWSLTGGNVVFTTAPAAGKKITIQRNTPFSRTTDYQSYNNSFRPPAVNKDFDWIWLKLQELSVADWILGTRIDALKNYVDDRDDELRAYLMEEIRKQGVALDQLDEYYNYLMQRLAQIAVDKGWDASFVVDGDKNQKQINDAQLALNSILKSSKYIDVRLLGIYPGLATNLGSLINSADALARSSGKGLYFPMGTYLATGLLPSVSWIGDGKDTTIIKNHSADGFDKFLDFKNSVKPTVYQDIKFSGSVNADPENDDWTGIFNTHFRGSCAFVATNSKNVVFNRCGFKESKLSPLRIWNGCKNIVMLDCDMSHSRGNFGDGVYIQNSQNIYGERLNISNVTRIGVVFEGNTKNCYMKYVNFDYAHHASINFGGGEFNGGFWAENASDIYLQDCTAKNSGQFSYLMTTGALLTGVAQAKFSLTRCTSDTANYGFLIRSKEGSITARHVLTDCKSYNSPIAYQVGARYDTDEFTLKDCFAEVIGAKGAVNIRAALSIGADFAYTSKLPSLTVENFTIKHSGVDLSKYTDVNFFDADVTFLDFARMKINLVNIHNVDSTIPAYIKNRLSAANTVDETLIKDSLCHLTRYRTSIKTQLDNCTIVGGNILSTGKVRLNNSSVKALFSVTSDDLKVNNCDMDFSTAADFFSYSTATSTNKITTKFNNCNFNKDITAGDYSLKLQMDGANKAKVLINGSEFYNLSDVTTTTNTHIWIVRSPTSVIYQNVIRDSTANLQKVNTSVSTSEPIGSTSIVLH